MRETLQHLVSFSWQAFESLFVLGYNKHPNKTKKEQSCPDLQTKMDGMCQYQRTWVPISSHVTDIFEFILTR